MTTKMDRNLVLLLASGHTVKVALRPGDLAGDGGPTAEEVWHLLAELPAVALSPLTGTGDMGRRNVVMAYVESMERPGIDDEPDELQRIDAYSPGESL